MGPLGSGYQDGIDVQEIRGNSIKDNGVSTGIGRENRQM